MNDAAVDPYGRLVAGSVASDFTPARGRLWLLDESWNAEVILEGLDVPNGLDWSPDGSLCYLVDSIAKVIYALRWGHGGPTARDVFVDLGDRAGLPDGLCVDAVGTVWVALYGAGRLLSFRPDGTELAPVLLPVRQPTSCAFAGDRLDRLVVTSAAEDLADRIGPLDGALLTVAAGDATGQTPVSFAG